MRKVSEKSSPRHYSKVDIQPRKISSYGYKAHYFKFIILYKNRYFNETKKQENDKPVMNRKRLLPSCHE